MTALLRLPALAVVIGAALGAAGCSVAPKYERPQVQVPTVWKLEAPWRESRPSDALPKGAWWRGYADPQLDALMEKALAGHPNLDLARARVAQARANLGVADSARYPQAALNLRDNRFRIAGNRPRTNDNAPNFTTTQSDYFGVLAVSYELDLFGRVQSTIEGARSSAEQTLADFENVRLVLTADLATAYFNLRAVDIELDVLARAIELQRRALGLTRSRYELGATSGLDVAQQTALLDSTLAQVDVLKRQRGVFENALATLTGTPAPSFSLAPQIDRAIAPPPIPIGIPSDVLERRPDVASAERAMAAANAQIGVAKAAYYPSINLGGTYGQQSRALSTLFDMPSWIWSLGATLVQPVFNAGRTDATVAATQAQYEATVATYRRVVLTAMQEVEDGIVGTTTLERAHAQAQVANASARKVLELATTRYEGGVATFLDVINAQQTLLASERLTAQLLGQRLLTSVFLVKALGGGYEGLKPLAEAPGADGTVTAEPTRADDPAARRTAAVAADPQPR